MVTLHGYVLRELLKTFALTLVALTALVTMGGGLYNVLRYEGISTGDLFGFIPMLIPIVLTLTMPVAALFAATMVYGRLAADSELLACRAAGVNIHRLFLSALLLAVFVASFTLLFGDLIIPDFVRRLDHYARANLRDIAYQKLQVSGHVRYESGGERFLLTARRAEIPTDAALAKQNLPTEDGLGYLLIEAPTFLQMKGNHLVRYASARYGLCQFDGRSTPVQVTVYVDNGRDFDFGGRIVRLERQQLGPISIPLKFERKASMVDLATLMRWRQRPWEVDKLRPEVEAFQLALTRERFLEDCQRRIDVGEVLALQDERDQTYRISAAGASVDHKGLMLTDARVVNLSSDNPDRPLYYEAAQVLLSLSPSVDGKRLLIELHLRATADCPVIEHNPRASDYTRGRPKPDLSLTDVLLVPEAMRKEMEVYTAATLFDPTFELLTSQDLSDKRIGLQKAGAKQCRKVSSLIHFRLGFTSSVLVTVLMAAALGVIFRGARALAAFGLACVPFGSVAILMVMARQLGEKEGTEMLGPILTWGGLACVAVADLLILRLGVRR